VTVKAYRYISNLSFRVIDAEYSKLLNKIIAVASQPSNQLHIYDPVTETDTTVNLNLVPTCVSVSPDGLYAAVGHNAWISYVNLSTGTLVKTVAVTADVFDVVLADNEYGTFVISGEITYKSLMVQKQQARWSIRAVLCRPPGRDSHIWS
jgi:hypothetical protein